MMYQMLNGKYHQDSPRGTFRSRLEGWSLICSTSDLCVGPQVSSKFQRLHNNVHDWIHGLSVPPSAINDPVFSLHHSNIDRILHHHNFTVYLTGQIAKIKSKNQKLTLALPYPISMVYCSVPCPEGVSCISEVKIIKETFDKLLTSI